MLGSGQQLYGALSKPCSGSHSFWLDQWIGSRFGKLVRPVGVNSSSPL